MSSAADPEIENAPPSDPDVKAAQKGFSSVAIEPGAPSDVDLMIGIQSQDSDSLSLSGGKLHGGRIAQAIDRQDGGLVERRRIKGAGSMRQVVRYVGDLGARVKMPDQFPSPYEGLRRVKAVGRIG